LRVRSQGRVKMRFLILIACSLPMASCVNDDGPLRARHGSPLYTYACDNGKSFQSRQIISGEVEVTAGGRTGDVTDANGEPVPGGPRLDTTDRAPRLTGMPGGPYEACMLRVEGEE
jgi:hypothetical protein